MLKYRIELLGTETKNTVQKVMVLFVSVPKSSPKVPNKQGKDINESNKTIKKM